MEFRRGAAVETGSTNVQASLRDAIALGSFKRFVEAGMRVVVLEQGDWPDYSKARANHPDFELTMGRYWSGNPNRRQAAENYPIDDSDSDISAVLYNGVGGGTVIYAAHWQRNMPSDFRVRTLDGVGDDWPLTYEDLSPFYERVEADFGVSGLAGDPAFPPSSVGGRKVIRFDSRRNNRVDSGAMSTAKEIEVAIQALSPAEREKLVDDLPSILPELRGEAAWQRILQDPRPRPALTALGDKIADEMKTNPERFAEIQDADFDKHS